MLARLEVRVREADEDFAKLSLFEKVGKEFHRVGTQTSCILVEVSFILLP